MNSPFSNNQRGFSLIEIMIAMLLGAFLLGGLLQIFMHSKKTYRVQEALSRLQENGRFAMDFLAKDIRMAGFIGCGNQDHLTNTLNTPTAFLYNFDTAIAGFEAISSTVWSPSITNLGSPPPISSPRGGSDIITIRRIEDLGFTVIAQATATDALKLDATATNTNLRLAGFTTSAAANNCTLTVVSDCVSAAVFQVSGVSSATLSHAKASVSGTCIPKNATDDLGKTYVGGQVYPINTVSYYVSTNPSNNPALYRKKGTVSSEELVEGIEQMQVLYGVDADTPADNTPNYYVSASVVPDWKKVVSVRISLLLVTLDNNLADKPVKYTYNGSTVTPPAGDRRLRKAFTSTIALRNRLG